jgi:mannosyltransferase OCH1-like enzyme
MGKKSDLDVESEKKMVKLLIPKLYDIEKLERIGTQDEDGGYIVPKDVVYNHHICFGVGNNVDFENQIEKNIKDRIICVDHTITRLPNNSNSRLEHIKKKVCDIDNKDSITLETIIESLQNNENLSLKIDIEGWEFPVLNKISDNLLTKLELIVVELHCIGNYGDRGGGDQGPIKDPLKKLQCIEKLTKHHDLIHISPNKIVSSLDLNLGYSFPYVVELTYVKKVIPDRQYNLDYTYPTKLDTNTGHKSIEAMKYLSHINEFMLKSTNINIILDLSNHNSIPKTVHIAWKNKDIWDNQSPLILNGIVNMKLINPDYSFKISDDTDIDTYIKNNIPIEDYNLLKNKHIIEKCDLWRLLKMYNEGGIYVDIDRYCNIPFEQIITPATKCVLPTCKDFDFSQDLMISCVNNPIFKTAIKLNLDKRKKGSNIYGLGAPIYMNAVCQKVFGKKYNQTPGKIIMDKFRELLDNHVNFVTSKEFPQNNTIIFKFNKSNFKPGNNKGKYEFYNEQNVKAWNKN